MEHEVKRKANWLYIFQQGYGLGMMPLGIFTTATTIYYLLVNNVPFLKDIFPEFWLFLLIFVAAGLPTGFIVGWVFIRSEVYKGGTKMNIYNYIITPNTIPLYEAQAYWCEANGHPEVAARLRSIVEASR